MHLQKYYFWLQFSVGSIANSKLWLEVSPGLLGLHFIVVDKWLITLIILYTTLGPSMYYVSLCAK